MAVLAVLYALFNEGYSASNGADLVRQGLCAEGIRLARLLAELMPDEPEALGQVQAAIAACHASAPTAAATNWAEIAVLYERLSEMVPSPAIALNRVVAVAVADGPAAGLLLVEQLGQGGALAEYHPLPATRADLLRRLGRTEPAALSYRQASSQPPTRSGAT